VREIERERERDRQTESPHFFLCKATKSKTNCERELQDIGKMSERKTEDERERRKDKET